MHSGYIKAKNNLTDRQAERQNSRRDACNRARLYADNLSAICLPWRMAVRGITRCYS